VARTTTIVDADYQSWLKDLKQRYRQSRIKAAVKVNDELLKFYGSLNPEQRTMFPELKGAKKVTTGTWNFKYYPTILSFLSMKEDYKRRRIEDALAKHISEFLMELGSGFAYMGRQKELRMPGGKSFFPDMLFYHARLKCYVVVELKAVEFEPEFAGKLNFYVSAADELLKDEHDNPSIGLLICKSKDNTVVEWSFRGMSAPIGVAAYELQKIADETIRKQLPTEEEIQKALESADDWMFGKEDKR
jgi:predicted nuclease of restriction endonuclease-like (RecB) superfamily